MIQFSWELAFLSAAPFVGLLVYIEANMLTHSGGKMPQNNSFAFISLTTTAWTLISCLAWYFLDFKGIAAAVPAVYPLYSLLGIIYSNYLLKDADVPDDPLELVISAKYLQFCKSFALVFIGLCLAVLADMLNVVKLPL